MDSFHKLADLFREFPGIGPRQAKRFVYFLLARDSTFLSELVRRIGTLQSDIAECGSCRRFFQKRGSPLCAACADPNRSDAELIVVAKDTDLDAIEKSGSFSGRYFVLGGTIPLLEKKSSQKIRSKELIQLTEKKAKAGTLHEIILALSANPDGEHTADELRKMLSPIAKQYSLTIATLGRGLSTGSELEYADSETIRSALRNRSK